MRKIDVLHWCHYLLLVAFSLLVSSCSKNAAAPGVPALPAVDTVKTYLALGDSYTIGQSVAAEGRLRATPYRPGNDCITTPGSVAGEQLILGLNTLRCTLAVKPW